MRAPLSVTVAQPSCVPHAVRANAEAHAAVVRDAGSRVIVFPEMSLTGYELDAATIAPDDPRLAPIVVACATTGCLALAGAPVADAAGGVSIAMLAIDGGGATVVYRKMWLGDEEVGLFSPGDAPAVLVVGGWRLGLAICKDTGVARHAADTAALGIDAYVAGTVMYPEERSVQDARARRNAADHGVWVAVASFAGPTGGGYARTAGCSGIWAPDGAVVAQAGPDAGAVVRAVLT
jgi:predicted amidohydrolase